MCSCYTNSLCNHLIILLLTIGHFPSMEGNLNQFLTCRILKERIRNLIFTIMYLLALFLHDGCAASQLNILPHFFKKWHSSTLLHIQFFINYYISIYIIFLNTYAFSCRHFQWQVFLIQGNSNTWKLIREKNH